MRTWTPGGNRLLKSIGSANDPMALDWVDNAPQELSVVHFSKRPASIRIGDVFVYYAAVHQKICGIVQVFSKPEYDAQLEHWQYFCQIRPKLIIKDFDRAPSIDTLNVEGGRSFRRVVQQMDYALLEDAEYDRALNALESAFDASRGDIRDPHFNEANAA